MNYKKYLPFAFILLATFFIQTQVTAQNTTSKPSLSDLQIVKSSSAYSEILLKRTELEADLEDLLIAYTLEFPKVKEIQYQLGLIKVEMDKLFAVKPSESQKLTIALGKLISRKIDLETELWNLKKKYNDDHPEVKKTKRKILVFESAVKDVLF